VDARCGRLDALVNNAGTNVFVDPLQATEEDWRRCMDLDLKSVWLTAKHAVPLMQKSGGGAIVNIASNHAFQTIAGSFPYPAAKAGVVGLTRILALDFAPYGIRVNAVCPGWIDTPLTERYFQEQPDPLAARRAVERLHPGGRIGTPEDVAAAVFFLASPEAAFITATTLTVDGGMSAKLM
ncbi:MAG TPA: SDR family oxidoreductase, partial [Limnochordia bacterium]